MPETAGKFGLIVELPVPSNSLGRMEVDLLCAEAKLAIMLDGAQHLADAEAHRRDRRKEALLQESGYVVLRFLGEDIGRQLSLAEQLYWSARDLKAAWLRAQHADWTEEQIAREVTRLFTHART